jgi:hypothetical protein
MLRKLTLLAALAVAGGASSQGCYVDTYGSYSLAYVAPGVAVVADYNYPVFYADNNFWRYDHGYWYRSRYADRGWVYANPPHAVATIYNPYGYVHYHPYGYYGHGYYYRGRYYRHPYYSHGYGPYRY